MSLLNQLMVLCGSLKVRNDKPRNGWKSRVHHKHEIKSRPMKKVQTSKKAMKWNAKLHNVSLRQSYCRFLCLTHYDNYMLRLSLSPCRRKSLFRAKKRVWSRNYMDLFCCIYFNLWLCFNRPMFQVVKCICFQKRHDRPCFREEKKW